MVSNRQRRAVDLFVEGPAALVGGSSIRVDGENHDLSKEAVRGLRRASPQTVSRRSGTPMELAAKGARR